MARTRDLAGRPAPRPKTIAEQKLTTDSSAFTTSKKDKRQIKHSTFVSKIAKDHSKKPKRRRPNKKLVTTLDSLADALPDVKDENGQADVSSQVNIIRHRTVKTKPGAMKRKEKLEKGERERFTRNMAEMSKPTPLATTAQAPDSTSNRWQALRTFISGTLERLPESTSAGK